MNDFDRRQWQADEAVRDAALTKQREKERKARERSARNAKRKLERLHKTLSDQGLITDFEDEFGESVLERLDQFGSAFHNLEKGRPGDALSFAQKRVVAAMNKKAKESKKINASTEGNHSDKDATHETKDTARKTRRGFSRKKSGFKPRVRHIEDDMPPEQSEEPFIPEYDPEPVAKRPFLRVVK